VTGKECRFALGQPALDYEARRFRIARREQSKVEQNGCQV
jgi:hypothetical protein